MADINLIHKEEFPLLSYSLLDWDVEVRGIPYQVIRVDNHAHCIGGHLDFGEGNCFWAYPLAEKPIYENLIEFDGEPGASWGIEYSPIHYIKTKWGETEIRRGHRLVVTRNGKPFYDGLMTFHEAVALVKDGVLDEHPLHLNARDFDSKCIGRKIWWRSQPAVITRFIDGQACVIIEPDGIDQFSVPPEFADDYDEEDCYSIKTNIFDKHIWWFRHEEGDTQ